jgi:hypothetical protein
MISAAKMQVSILITEEIDSSDEYLVFGGAYTEEYFEQYEQSEQCSYFPNEEEYSEYLASLENELTDFN